MLFQGNPSGAKKGGGYQDIAITEISHGDEEFLWFSFFFVRVALF